MNYSSQLKGWAIDRVLELAKLHPGNYSNAREVTQEAQKLVDYCYSAEEDIQQMRERIREIEALQEQYDAIALQPASNALDTGAN